MTDSTSINTTTNWGVDLSKVLQSRPVTPQMNEMKAHYRLNKLHDSDDRDRGLFCHSRKKSSRSFHHNNISSPSYSDPGIENMHLSPSEVRQFDSLVKNLLGIQSNGSESYDNGILAESHLEVSRYLPNISRKVKDKEIQSQPEDDELDPKSRKGHKVRLMRILDNRRKKIAALNKLSKSGTENTCKILATRQLNSSSRSSSTRKLLHAKCDSVSVDSSRLSKKIVEDKLKQREEFVAEIEKNIFI